MLLHLGCRGKSARKKREKAQGKTESDEGTATGGEGKAGEGKAEGKTMGTKGDKKGK